MRFSKEVKKYAIPVYSMKTKLVTSTDHHMFLTYSVVYAVTFKISLFDMTYFNFHLISCFYNDRDVLEMGKNQ